MIKKRPSAELNYQGSQSVLTLSRVSYVNEFICEWLDFKLHWHEATGQMR